ncbi:response regulator transcription factor [Geminisphaera colitermitum]|uniref:response regulator transcription factor n=1 Tax=Geminisphaera colitermitum TaxID=1148786 RepID=UPI000158CEF7|nr:response regulator transcription factor [Geminisphaera colitermitum]
MTTSRASTSPDADQQERNRPVTVAIADDHHVVRQGIEALLRMCPDMEYVGGASTVDEARQLVHRTRPDVLVSDLSMPGGSGVGFLRNLRRECPDTRIVVLTMHATALAMQDAFDSGAHAFVAKDDAFDTLVSIIRRVHSGEEFLFSRTMKEVTGGSQETPRLAPREREVLQGITKGLSTKEIGAQLFLSPKTVEVYRGRLMKKFNVTKGTELIHHAVASGIVPMTPSSSSIPTSPEKNGA